MTKLEAVAEAMRAKRAELIAKPLDRVWPDLARAAVEAMREIEPSDKMISAIWSMKFANTQQSFTACWCALIDAALAEEQPK